MADKYGGFGIKADFRARIAVNQRSGMDFSSVRQLDFALIARKARLDKIEAGKDHDKPITALVFGSEKTLHVSMFFIQDERLRQEIGQPKDLPGSMVKAG